MDLNWKTCQQQQHRSYFGSLLWIARSSNVMPWPYKRNELEKQNRSNCLLQVETKHTWAGARTHDGQSSEPFHPTSKILTIFFFRVRFRVVEILLVARHEMSQIKILHDIVNIYDICRRTQSLLDYWRELPSFQSPDCWESTRSNTYTHNSLKKGFASLFVTLYIYIYPEFWESQNLDDFLDSRQRT